MRSSRVLPSLASTLAVLLLAGCGTNTAESDTGAPSAQDSASSGASAAASTGAPGSASSGSGNTDAAPGAYIGWADYDRDRASYADSHVVLFFHAPWCPDCQATEASLNADGVPAGLTVVKVDFDTATDLRQEYGITVQHSFVEIDADGTALKKWTGTHTGAEILDQLV